MGYLICATARSLVQVEIITVSVFVLVPFFCTCFFLFLNRVDVLLRVFSWALPCSLRCEKTRAYYYYYYPDDPAMHYYEYIGEGVLLV
jgi:hypothetical protein